VPIIVRPNTSKAGPVKIQEAIGGNNISAIKKPATNYITTNTTQKYPKVNPQPQQRNSSKDRNDANERPSTAPSKNDNQNMNNNNALRRLPSPNVKSNNPLANNKNMMNNSGKQRSQSPMTMVGQNRIMPGGSFKGPSSSKMFK